MLLPLEVLVSAFRYLPILELHTVVRHVSSQFNAAVDFTLSTPSMIRRFNESYKIMWTLGDHAGRCLSQVQMGQVQAHENPMLSELKWDALRVALLFSAADGKSFSAPSSGLAVLADMALPSANKQLQASLRNIHSHRLKQFVEIFFCWSVQTVYSTKVSRIESNASCERCMAPCDAIEHSYIGIVDYRVLLNWVVAAHLDETKRWFIPR